jgi:hypothetical protein
VIANSVVMSLIPFMLDERLFLPIRPTPVNDLGGDPALFLDSTKLLVGDKDLRGVLAWERTGLGRCEKKPLLDLGRGDGRGVKSWSWVWFPPICNLATKSTPLALR